MKNDLLVACSVVIFSVAAEAAFQASATIDQVSMGVFV
jgi:hypothetical protein